jgi:hypothetical protein
MPEIVKPQIGQFRLQARGIPSAVRQLVAYRVTAEREAKAPVLSDLFSQHSNSISIECPESLSKPQAGVPSGS